MNRVRYSLETVAFLYFLLIFTLLSGRLRAQSV